MSEGDRRSGQDRRMSSINIGTASFIGGLVVSAIAVYNFMAGRIEESAEQKHRLNNLEEHFSEHSADYRAFSKYVAKRMHEMYTSIKVIEAQSGYGPGGGVFQSASETPDLFEYNEEETEPQE